MSTTSCSSWPRDEHRAGVAGARLSDWAETKDTVPIWIQLVGKVRMAHSFRYGLTTG